MTKFLYSTCSLKCSSIYKLQFKALLSHVLRQYTGALFWEHFEMELKFSKLTMK